MNGYVRGISLLSAARCVGNGDCGRDVVVVVRLVSMEDYWRVPLGDMVGR